MRLCFSTKQQERQRLGQQIRLRPLLRGLRVETFQISDAFFCDSFSKVQNKQTKVNKERQRKFRRKAFCHFLGRQNFAEKSPQRKISDLSKGKKNYPWLDFD